MAATVRTTGTGPPRMIPLPLTDVSTPETGTPPPPEKLIRGSTEPPQPTPTVFTSLPGSNMSLCFTGDPNTPFSDIRSMPTPGGAPPPGVLSRAKTTPAGDPASGGYYRHATYYTTPTATPAGSVYSPSPQSTFGYVCPSPVGVPSPVKLEHWQVVGQRMGALFADMADMSPSPVAAAAPIKKVPDPFCLQTAAARVVHQPVSLQQHYPVSVHGLPAQSASPSSIASTYAVSRSVPPTPNPTPVSVVSAASSTTPASVPGQRVASLFQSYDSPFFPTTVAATVAVTASSQARRW